MVQKSDGHSKELKTGIPAENCKKFEIIYQDQLLTAWVMISFRS